MEEVAWQATEVLPSDTWPAVLSYKEMQIVVFE